MKNMLRTAFSLLLSRHKQLTGFSFLFALGIFFVLMLTGTNLWARAGGGGNYSGGSSDWGGGGGGDSEAEIIFYLIYLAIRYPQVGVPLLIIVAVGLVIKHRLNPDNTTSRAIRRLSEMHTTADSDVSTIQKRDDSFQPEAFLNWVKKINNDVQDCWSKGDMSSVRNYLSDGLFRRFAVQLKIMKHQNVQNAIADHRIINCVIHAVEQDTHFDTIHVAIEADVRDIEVSATLSHDEAVEKAKNRKPQRYTEIWSFLRKPGTKTASDKGFVHGKCPNCGAPFGNNQTAKCEFCNALVNSGEYDWVLAEITQPQEWHRASTGQVKGMLKLQQKDPSFNRQVAEDRASYVFWRWIEAMVMGKIESLSKCASVTLQQIVQKNSPQPHYKTAVGSVDLMETQVKSMEGKDTLYLKILWSSASSSTGIPIHRNQVFVMGREQVPSQNTGLAHARCPNCHGSLPENDSNVCDYCGTTLTFKNTDWILEEITHPYEYRQQYISTQKNASNNEHSNNVLPEWTMPNMASRQERALLLMNMAAVVIADGVVTKQERKLLKTASKRWDVPMEMVDPILSGQVSPESVKEMRPSDPSVFVDGLIGAALIDGKIDSKELKLLMEVSEHLGLDATIVRGRINTLDNKYKSEQVDNQNA